MTPVGISRPVDGGPCLRLCEDSGVVLPSRDLRYTQTHVRTVDRADAGCHHTSREPQAAWPRQAAAGGEKSDVDYIFDAPVEVAEALTRFRHDKVSSELGENPFEALE
jgi:hypothetical protein